MLRSALATAIFLVTLAITPLAVAGEAEELLEIEALSGLNNFFDDIPTAFAASPRTQGMFTDERYLDAWETSVVEFFVPATMRKEMFAVFAGALSAGERSALLDFLRSDFGRRVSALEEAAQSEDPIQSQANAKAAFEAATPERKALVAELTEAIENEAGKQLFIESLRSMMLAAALVASRGEGPLPWDRIDAQLDLIAPQLLKAIDEETLVRGVYTYRDLTDADFGRYGEFLKSEPARKFYQLIVYGQAMVVDKAMAALGTAFATRLLQVGA